jgi:hypothetical protein
LDTGEWKVETVCETSRKNEFLNKRGTRKNCIAKRG